MPPLQLVPPPLPPPLLPPPTPLSPKPPPFLPPPLQAASVVLLHALHASLSTDDTNLIAHAGFLDPSRPSSLIPFSLPDSPPSLNTSWVVCVGGGGEGAGSARGVLESLLEHSKIRPGPTFELIVVLNGLGDKEGRAVIEGECWCWCVFTMCVYVCLFVCAFVTCLPARGRE